MGAHCEGVKGATADFVCFHCPLSHPQARPPATKKTSSKKKLLSILVGRAHRRDNMQVVGKAAWGGASEEAQSYWQGRFAACALVDFVL